MAHQQPQCRFSAALGAIFEYIASFFRLELTFFLSIKSSERSCFLLPFIQAQQACKHPTAQGKSRANHKPCAMHSKRFSPFRLPAPVPQRARTGGGCGHPPHLAENLPHTATLTALRHTFAAQAPRHGHVQAIEQLDPPE